MSRTLPHLALPIAAAFLAAPAPAQQPPLPDFGVMHNSDGDVLYGYQDSTINSRYVEQLVRSLADTPIRTHMWSIAAGSDIMHYPTQVASNYGWRSTPADNSAEWSARVNYGKSWAAEGYDPLRVVANTVKSMGDYFIPSYRMNDDHFVVDPLNYPLTGKFWIDNQDKTLGSSPVAGYDYSNLLNYEYEAVRDFRMDVIHESIDRYADVMDGYELDFNRVQIFFAPGEAQTHAHLITDMVASVRQKLDQVAASTGRSQYLFVRVPPAVENNQWSGLEVEKWVREGMVDVVLPSQLQTLSHDMPIDPLVTIAEASGSHTRVYPSLYPRTNYGCDLKPRPGPTGYTGAPNHRVASAELTRGSLSNHRYLGAEGFQMYNYGLPLFDIAHEVADDMASENPTLGKDRVFAVTPGYFNDHEDNYEYAKQLPHTVSRLGRQDFDLLVGDDIRQMILERPEDVILRFGLTGVTAQTAMSVLVNGVPLHSGSMAPGYYTLNTTPTADGPAAYFQTTVGNLLALQQGHNVITLVNANASRDIRVTDIQLGVFGASIPTPDVAPVVMKQPKANMIRQVYYDGLGPSMTFEVHDREDNGFEIGQGGIYVTGQVSSYTSGGYSNAAGFIFEQAMYYPSVEGELESLDYELWIGRTSGSRPSSAVGLLLMQDGKFYTLADPIALELDDPNTTLTLAAAGLTASDFMEEKADGDGLVLDVLSHPDFSAEGAPIFLGFLLSRMGDPTIGGNDQPYTDLDDFIFTFRRAPIPEPATAAWCLLLGAGALLRSSSSSSSSSSTSPPSPATRAPKTRPINRGT